MTTHRWPRGLLIAGAFALLVGTAVAQDTARSQPPSPAPVGPGRSSSAPAPAAPASPLVAPRDLPPVLEVPFPPSIATSPDSVTRDTVRVGADYTLPAGQTARQVVVISGSATIEGRVERDVVVIMGDVHLAGTASVGGDLVDMGGTVRVDAGATVAHDVVSVGGALDSAPGFTPGGEQTVIGAPVIGNSVRALLPWATRGLLWGRLIVPGVPWIWGVVALVFLAYLVLNVVLDRPVRACADELTAKPLSTFLVGLLVLALTGPVALLLAVSVIGLALIPFLVCAVGLGGIVGKVGVLRAVGGGIVRQDALDNRAQAVRSFVIGFVAVTVLYAVPVIGFITFATLGVFGLGAAAFAFLTGIRRENPAFASAPRPAPPSAAPDGALGDAAPAPVVPPSLPELVLLPKATFTSRLGAFALDVALVLMTVGLLGVSRPGRVLLLLLVYRVAFWTWMGTTVGGLICQLRVVRTDGVPLRFIDAVVRGLSSVFSLVVLGLGYLWILKDADGQAWHDKIAGTFVVRVPKHWPRT